MAVVSLPGYFIVLGRELGHIVNIILRLRSITDEGYSMGLV